MRIRAVAIESPVIYSSYLLDGANPMRPVVEVDVPPGAVHELDEALLLPLTDFVVMVDALQRQPVVDALRARDRTCVYEGEEHVRFPVWRIAPEVG